MQATLRMIDKAFEKAGIAVIDPAGQAFNPEFHEAMVTQPSAEQPPGSVLAVVQKGFTPERPAAAARPGRHRPGPGRAAN